MGQTQSSPLAATQQSSPMDAPEGWKNEDKFQIISPCSDISAPSQFRHRLNNGLNSHQNVSVRRSSRRASKVCTGKTPARRPRSRSVPPPQSFYFPTASDKNEATTTTKPLWKVYRKRFQTKYIHARSRLSLLATCHKKRKEDQNQYCVQRVEHCRFSDCTSAKEDPLVGLTVKPTGEVVDTLDGAEPQKAFSNRVHMEAYAQLLQVATKSPPQAVFLKSSIEAPDDEEAADLLNSTDSIMGLSTELKKEHQSNKEEAGIYKESEEGFYPVWQEQNAQDHQLPPLHSPSFFLHRLVASKDNSSSDDEDSVQKENEAETNATEKNMKSPVQALFVPSRYKGSVEETKEMAQNDFKGEPTDKTSINSVEGFPVQNVASRKLRSFPFGQERTSDNQAVNVSESASPSVPSVEANFCCSETSINLSKSPLLFEDTIEGAPRLSVASTLYSSDDGQLTSPGVPEFNTIPSKSSSFAEGKCNVNDEKQPAANQDKILNGHKSSGRGPTTAEVEEIASVGCQTQNKYGSQEEPCHTKMDNKHFGKSEVNSMQQTIKKENRTDRFRPWPVHENKDVKSLSSGRQILIRDSDRAQEHSRDLGKPCTGPVAKPSLHVNKTESIFQPPSRIIHETDDKRSSLSGTRGLHFTESFGSQSQPTIYWSCNTNTVKDTNVSCAHHVSDCFPSDDVKRFSDPFPLGVQSGEHMNQVITKSMADKRKSDPLPVRCKTGGTTQAEILQQTFAFSNKGTLCDIKKIEVQDEAYPERSNVPLTDYRMIALGNFARSPAKELNSAISLNSPCPSVDSVVSSESVPTVSNQALCNAAFLFSPSYAGEIADLVRRSRTSLPMDETDFSIDTLGSRLRITTSADSITIPVRPSCESEGDTKQQSYRRVRFSDANDVICICEEPEGNQASGLSKRSSPYIGKEDIPGIESKLSDLTEATHHEVEEIFDRTENVDTVCDGPNDNRVEPSKFMWTYSSSSGLGNGVTPLRSGKMDSKATNSPLLRFQEARSKFSTTKFRPTDIEKKVYKHSVHTEAATKISEQFLRKQGDGVQHDACTEVTDPDEQQPAPTQLAGLVQLRVAVMEKRANLTIPVEGGVFLPAKSDRISTGVAKPLTSKYSVQGHEASNPALMNVRASDAMECIVANISPTLIKGEVVACTTRGTMAKWRDSLSCESFVGSTEEVSAVDTDDDIFGEILHPRVLDEEDSKHSSQESMVKSDLFRSEHAGMNVSSSDDEQSQDDFDKLLNYENHDHIYEDTSIDEDTVSTIRQVKPLILGTQYSSYRLSSAGQSENSEIDTDTVSTVHQIRESFERNRFSIISSTDGSTQSSQISWQKPRLIFRDEATVKPEEQRSTSDQNPEKPRTWRVLAAAAQQRGIRRDLDLKADWKSTGQRSSTTGSLRELSVNIVR